MKNKSIHTLKPLLETPKKIAIIPHRNPDGDAMGSTLALYHYLSKTQEECRVIAPNAYPEFLAWLPGNEKVLNYESQREIAQNYLREAELIFTLDFNSLGRTGEMREVLQEIVEEEKALFVMIDHHEEPEDYADYTYSVPESSSTCELVYNFIQKMEDGDKITAAIATCLYTGIMTDTGSFKFSSTTGTTHRIVADLMDRGAPASKIHENIYDTKSPNQLQLLGVALKNMKVIPTLRTAYITLSREELNQHQFKKGDTEGIVNYGLSLKGIILAVIFIEDQDENSIKISLRSKGDFDVNRMAREYFNGGGHLNAAGGKSAMGLTETVRYFERLLKNYPHQLGINEA